MAATLNEAGPAPTKCTNTLAAQAHHADALYPCATAAYRDTHNVLLQLANLYNLCDIFLNKCIWV